MNKITYRIIKVCIDPEVVSLIDGPNTAQLCELHERFAPSGAMRLTTPVRIPDHPGKPVYVAEYAVIEWPSDLKPVIRAEFATASDGPTQ